MGEQLRWSPKLYHLFCSSSSCGEHRPPHGIASSNNKSKTTTAILIIVTSALHIFFLTRQENTSFRRVLDKSVGSAVVFCLSIAVIWPIAALLTYHMRVCPFFVLDMCDNSSVHSVPSFNLSFRNRRHHRRDIIFRVDFGSTM
jgi:hypothetical protein